MPTVAYYTLGCKVNQYETEQIRVALENAGFQTVPFGSKADVYVINTCTVTKAADAKSRAAVRKAGRLNRDAFIVVTGCYAELEPETVSRIDRVDLVVGNREKENIPKLIVANFSSRNSQYRESAADEAGFASVSQTADRVLPRIRTRAIVKVQDGCDHFCTYCVVPFARPDVQSRPLVEIIDEVKALVDCGYKEIVLAGIRLGSYEAGKSRLPDLIAEVAGVAGVERIRLSSIEPWEVDDLLLDVMRLPKVCRHLHIPLQSGDDTILARMNRPYSAEQYLSLVNLIREKIPGVGITTDVMVGFPGESELAFENTCEVVWRAQFSRLHVFRYSVRPRTLASSMPDQIPERAKTQRAAKLINIGRESAKSFAQNWIGRTLDVLAETTVAVGKDEKTSCAKMLPCEGAMVLKGFSDNYIEVHFLGRSGVTGKIVPVRILDVDDLGRAIGEMEKICS